MLQKRIATPVAETPPDVLRIVGMTVEGDIVAVSYAYGTLDEKNVFVRKGDIHTGESASGAQRSPELVKASADLLTAGYALLEARSIGGSGTLEPVPEVVKDPEPVAEPAVAEAAPARVR